ncbi:MAG: GNAT family N-acetyltransferase [Planctomycetaceae bacterium]|jgi:CelD/BcsL family acetyltransferase involved in cellulose biosynthesis|nr:GNAT family N-acetyltransferase [Planctomycetaceae bacterium]
MNTRLITTDEELISIKDSWNHLVRENSETNVPFFSWDWFYCAWLYFGKPAGQQLAVVIVEDGDQLVGVLPLVFGSKKSTGITYRTLGFCNVGIIPRNSVYWLQNRVADSIFDAITRQIFDVKQKWDVLELANISNETLFHNYWLQEHLGTAIIQTKGLSSPFVLLEGLTYEQYFSKYGNKEARRRFKRNTERFAAENKRWEMTIFESVNDIQQGIDLALAVRAASWKGAFRNESYIKFYRELFDVLAQRNEVLIPVLMLDDIPIAAEFITGCNDCYFLHTNDYDLRFRETSPGICLLHNVLITAFERRWKLFDFTGDDYDYKKDCNTGIRYHSTFQIFHNGFKSRFIYSAKTFWLPLFRKILRKPEPNDFITKIERFKTK